ncbi:HD domain-containing protein [Pseudoalteromonas luteoviolacea]|uniref:HD domain-containing protein n=1 Tax=Pseudoalteromonas luteoviolacea S4060-1 TaxID=1365257 RepID=A0A162B5H9_9GAMM|nr:HD domain-containing protein [Pseudoalteromonas luteoviolacea]KZN64407.1 hypothetical protein N478_22185 [Pseudoalteromonas luteoviolacea S4060-1]
MSYPVADKILSKYINTIGEDFTGYRNHVMRMLNYCHYLHENLDQAQSEKLQIAAAFHDIALWTHKRVDYLVPSYNECRAYLASNDQENIADEVQIIIDMHHLIKTYHGPYEELTEVFRKADLVDFSGGLIKFGIAPSFIKTVKAALPNAGFHKTLMRFTLIQLSRKPWDPLPMMRCKNLYNRSSN